MRFLSNVQGSEELAVPLVVQKTTVYIKENIRKLDPSDMSSFDGEMNENINLWQWDEYQYDKDEYIGLMDNLNHKLQADLDYLSIMTGVELNV